MDKEEYINSKKEIEKSMYVLSQKMTQLKKDYINHNRVFNDNEKVEIVTKEHPYWNLSIMRDKEPTGINKEKKRFSFISGYRVDYQDNVIPLLKKCKKDGTQSKQSDYTNTSLDSINPLTKPF